MKKTLFLFIVILLTPTLCRSQTFDEEKEKIQHKAEISFAMNSVDAQLNQALFDTWVFPSANYYGYFGNKNNRSYSFSVIPKYTLNEDWAFRIEIGFTAINLFSHFDGINDSLAQAAGISASSNITKIDTIQQNIYRFLPGVQYTFARKKNMNFYGGGGIFYLQYSKMHWADYITDNTTPDRYTNYIANTKGGFSAGLNLFGGLKLKFCTRFIVGTEIMYAISYYHLGGAQEGIMYSHFTNGSHITTPWSIADNSSKGIQFSKIMPSINMGFLIYK